MVWEEEVAAAVEEESRGGVVVGVTIGAMMMPEPVVLNANCFKVNVEEVEERMVQMWPRPCSKSFSSFSATAQTRIPPTV
jgi:cyanophycinase-like exopeptidase